MTHLEHKEVHKRDRLTVGLKYAFWTNHKYNEVIFPEFKGKPVLSLKEFEKCIAYNGGHVASIVLKHSLAYGVLLHDLSGHTPMEGAQETFQMHTPDGFVRARSLVRSGIMFISSPMFENCYFVTPTLEKYNEAVTFMRQLSHQLNPHPQYLEKHLVGV